MRQISLPYQLRLASKSPRRSQLLIESRIPFSLINVDVDEIYPDDMPIQKVPEYLASLKASAALAQISSTEMVLAADTVVIANNKILGKPTDPSDARDMLSSLSENSHVVITGVSIQNATKSNSFSVTSEVEFGPLSKEEVDYYIQEFNPFDKAGGYGIQDWIGWCRIKKINGSYSNIMGLPMFEVYEKLMQLTSKGAAE